MNGHNAYDQRNWSYASSITVQYEKETADYILYGPEWPHEDQIREQVAMTPEERWRVFIKLRRMYFGLTGEPPKLPKRITLMRPPWM
ncbi:hypothetical protein GCM10028818_32560 [Spirosoma horti]